MKKITQKPIFPNPTHLPLSNTDFQSSMEHEQDKQSQTPEKTPYTQLEQVNSDFMLAIGLQEQDGTFTFDSESDSSSDNNNDYDDADYFLSQEFESELYVCILKLTINSQGSGHSVIRLQIRVG